VLGVSRTTLYRHLRAMRLEGVTANPARQWLVSAGWTTAPELVCPEHSGLAADH